jgi:hypothetical protein
MRKKHGGARHNAGRKKKEPTKRVSVRISKLEAVKKLNQEP